MYSRLVWSANIPSAADPIPPMPNANPKNNPDIVPIFPGINSCAYTSIAENAEARMNPMMILSSVTIGSDTYGSIRVNGAAPSIDHQITNFLPNLSPSDPPASVPAATAARKINKWIWADCTDTLNLCIR